MKVDRARFLALTCAMAAGAACREQAAPVSVPTLDIGAAPDAGDQSPGPIVATSSTPDACDDSISAPPCDTIGEVDPTCEEMREFPGAQCKKLETILRPSASRALVECLHGLSASGLCDYSKIYRCEHAAFERACPDANVKAYCAREGVTDETDDQGGKPTNPCVYLATALTDDGRQRVGACGWTYACVESFLFSDASGPTAE